MKTSDTGQALIKAFESCLKKLPDGNIGTYYCPADVLTIGWGTTRDDAPDLKHGDEWTQAQCDFVFVASLAKYEAAVLAKTGPRGLTQNQFDALVSLVYNCGPGALDGTVGRAVRDGRDADVPKAINLWNKCDGRVLPGLVRRRKAEGQLYAGDIVGASETAQAHLPGTMPQKVDVPGALVLIPTIAIPQHPGITEGLPAGKLGFWGGFGTLGAGAFAEFLDHPALAVGALGAVALLGLITHEALNARSASDTTGAPHVDT